MHAARSRRSTTVAPSRPRRWNRLKRCRRQKQLQSWKIMPTVAGMVRRWNGLAHADRRRAAHVASGELVRRRVIARPSNATRYASSQGTPPARDGAKTTGRECRAALCALGRAFRFGPKCRLRARMAADNQRRRAVAISRWCAEVKSVISLPVIGSGPNAPEKRSISWKDSQNTSITCLRAVRMANAR